MGIPAVELGTGNYPGNAHCDPDALLADEPAQRTLRPAVESRGIVISALASPETRCTRPGGRRLQATRQLKNRRGWHRCWRWDPS